MDMDDRQEEDLEEVQEERHIGIAFTDGEGASFTMEELVYEGEIYWGTLLRQEGRTLERHQEIERANHALLVDTITTDSIPPAIANIVATYAHLF